MSAGRTSRRCFAYACRAAGAMVIASFAATAHESPSEIIATLTSEMSGAAPDPTLLYRRALEYRALGKLDLAAADLRAALQVDPQNLPALVEAGRVDLVRGKFAPALERITRAITLVANERECAPLRITRAAIHESLGNLKMALEDCDIALQQPLATPDWYLTRSRIEAKLGLHYKRTAGLRRGFEDTRSAILEAEWIEALIDAREFTTALQQIEPKLTTIRWQSSWLIRRARARQGLGEAALAQADLQRAIAEINERLRPERRNPLLVRDRDFAQTLLDAFFPSNQKDTSY